MNDNMRCVGIDNYNGTITLTVEVKTPRLFRKPKIEHREFLCVTEKFGKYYQRNQWLELPNKILVSASLSFQLDAWKKQAENCGAATL